MSLNAECRTCIWPCSNNIMLDCAVPENISTPPQKQYRFPEGGGGGGGEFCKTENEQKEQGFSLWWGGVS